MEAVRRNRKQINMTEGPLLGKIVSFVLPLMLTNLLQAFYNAADMMVVSLSTEVNAVGAIGTTGSLTALILNFLMGFSVGATVVIARHLGAGNARDASRATHTAILMGAALGVIGLVVGLSISREVLILMGTRGNLLDLALLYTRFYFIGAPFTALSNFTIGVFRAKGDTRTPLFVLMSAGLLNVGLNLFFVLVMHLSVEGVAIATMIANAASAVALLSILARDEGPCRFSPRALCFDKASLAGIFKIGFPAGLQNALFSISNLIIQSSVLQVNNAAVPAGETYQPVVNGNAAAANLENFTFTAIGSVHQAAIAFTGQNVGAGQYRRVWRVMGCCYLVTTCIALFFGFGTILLRRPLLSLYGVREAAAGSLAMLAYETACKRFYYMLAFRFLHSWMDTGSGVLRGLGKSLTSTIVVLIGACVFRMIWIATAFRAVSTIEIIYLSYPISWAATALFLLLFCAITLRRRIRETEN